MKEKPRHKNESILTKNLLFSIGSEGIVIGLVTLFAFLIGYSCGDTGLASTMAFGVLCISRLIHGYNCKSEKSVVFTKQFFNNKYLQLAFIIGFILITIVLTMPALSGLFSVTSLNFRQLLTVYGLAFINLPVIQIIKAIRTYKKCGN